MADPKLKLGNDIWATKQKSLLAYNDEGGNFKSLPFQVDRISSGTYVGRNGLIQTAASNEPRVDFTSNTKGALLLEPQRTNSLTYSEDFTNAAYSKQGTSSVTGNTTTAPDGSLTADTLSGATGTGVSGNVLRRNVSGTVDATLSIYVKSLGSTSFTIYMRNGSSGQVQSQDITPNDTWQRVTLTHDPDNGQIYFGNTNGDVAIWGAQLEAGTYATSIIPTSGGAVTRVVDTCNITGLQASIMNGASEATLFVELEFEREINGDAMQWRSSTLNAGRGYFYATQMGFADTYGANGVVIYGLTENSKLKAAFRLNSLSNATVFLNGTKGGTGNGNTWGDIGQLLFNGTYWKMKINEIKMYNTALSDSELQALTTI